MENNKPDNEEIERAELLAQMDELHAEIRRRVLALVSHSDIPEFFKNHPVVEEIVK